MVRQNLKKYIVGDKSSLLDTLRVIDCNNKGFAIVVDDIFHIIGVITDGDIRRELLKGTSLDASVIKTCNTNYVSMRDNSPLSLAGDMFKKNEIKFLPIVDECGTLVNLLTKNQMHTLLIKDIHPDLSYDFEALDEDVIDTEVYYRPWGFYKTTVLNDFYQAKVISVKPEGQLSFQYHNHREEHWVVVHGNGTVQLDDSLIEVHTGSGVFIPKGCKHRLTNISTEDSLILCEVQIGDYLGEDDIVRLEDKYGRVQ